MVNPLIRPYFLGGGGIGGVPLDSHDLWWVVPPMGGGSMQLSSYMRTIYAETSRGESVLSVLRVLFLSPKSNRIVIESTRPKAPHK